MTSLSDNNIKIVKTSNKLYGCNLLIRRVSTRERDPGAWGRRVIPESTESAFGLHVPFPEGVNFNIQLSLKNREFSRDKGRMRWTYADRERRVQPLPIIQSHPVTDGHIGMKATAACDPSGLEFVASAAGMTQNGRVQLRSSTSASRLPITGPATSVWIQSGPVPPTSRRRRPKPPPSRCDRRRPRSQSSGPAHSCHPPAS